MRYSLRWLLVAVAYTALVAAAIGSASSVLTDGVWVLTFATMCYAFVISITSSGNRRAMAIGFVTFAAVYVVCLLVIPKRVPTVRLASGLGYVVSETGQVFEDVSDGLNRYTPMGTIARRTGDAVLVVAAGLIGCGIGALAFRHSREP